MKYKKFVTPVIAGVLAMSIGMVGCGGSNNTTNETTETTEETTEQTAEETPTYPEETTTEEQVQNAEGEQNAPEEQVEDGTTQNEESKVLYWEGTLDSGDVFIWADGEDENGDDSVIMYDTHANDEMIAFHGKATLDENGVATITDTETGATFTFTVTGTDADSNITIDAGEHGKGTVKGITEAEFVAEVEKIEKEVENFLNNLIDQAAQAAEEELTQELAIVREIRSQAQAAQAQ